MEWEEREGRGGTGEKGGATGEKGGGKRGKRVERSGNKINIGIVRRDMKHERRKREKGMEKIQILILIASYHITSYHVISYRQRSLKR